MGGIVVSISDKETLIKSLQSILKLPIFLYGHLSMFLLPVMHPLNTVDKMTNNRLHGSKKMPCDPLFAEHP